MEVIYYQGFIFLSIVFTRLFFSKFLIWVCCFWTAFTMVNLFFPPLILIQLLVVWGTYSWIKVDKNKSNEVERLRKEEERTASLLSDLSKSIAASVEEAAKEKEKVSELQEILRRIDPECETKLTNVLPKHTTVISGEAHYDFLIHKIRSATESIFILSGWIGDNVVSHDFLRALESRLKSNVKIFIGYGYRDYRGEHKRTESTNRALRSLENLAEFYPNALIIKEFATHEKLLIVDERIIVFTSANWLNNKNYVNAERGVEIRDCKLASEESQRILDEYFS